MLRLTDLAHNLVREVLSHGAWAVDATVGNGHDTRLLADAVGPTGHVIGFDVQAAALASARLRLAGLPQVTLHLCGHEHLAAHLPAAARHTLAAVMFNLGYLPGAEKTTMTRAVTTLAALEQATVHLAIGGRITVMLYIGHAGGVDEADAVRTFAAALPAAFTCHQIARIKTEAAAPELLLIERVR